MHQHRLLLNESLEDVCSKQEAIYQQHEPSPRLPEQSAPLASPSLGSALASLHPEIVSGHHLPPRRLSIDEESFDSWGRHQTTLSLMQQQPPPQQLLPQTFCTADAGAKVATAVSGTRVSTSGSSFNSDSSSILSQHHSHPHSHVSHPHRAIHGEFCRSLTRADMGKKVSFVNPTDSLIIYGGGSDVLASDTQV